MSSQTPYESVPTAPPLSPDFNSPNANEGLLGPSGAPLPAPSLIGRDSTYSSLAGHATPDNRGSWSSNAALGAGAGAGAGAAAGRATPGGSRLANEYNADGPADVSEKPRWANQGSGAPKKSRKWLWIALALLAILAVGLGVGLGVGLTRNKSSSNAGNTSGAAVVETTTDAQGSTMAVTRTSSSTAAPSATPTTGGMGSLITMENGETFTYDNALGGEWYFDEADPFNNGARPNSWTPKLSEEWVWGQDRMLGVNLGGWLNTEPFIVPHLYETYATGPDGQVAIDEFTLSQNMGDNLTAAMTEHYDTFITERDFAAIASAGLNWIRLPIGFWAIETWEGEPYLEGVSWTYVLKALKWARKYGLRVNFDLHAVPGSQNGWNHSGKIGTVNWLAGAMGLANGQRSLDYMKQIAEFINQPEYQNLIMINGILNEPRGDALSRETIGSFYLHAYEMIRDITGYGKGQAIAIFDGFLGGSTWFGFAPNADRLILDTHQYMVFQDQNPAPLSQIKNVPCQAWAVQANDTSRQWGINFSGEFSNAINDCGIWVNGVNQGNRYEGTFAGYEGRRTGSCDYWNDHTQWTNETKADMMDVAKATMDAFQNYFFWTWKIGRTNTASYTPNPFWSYELGLREGWIPKDPREAIGHCAAVAGVTGEPFSGTYSEAYMTGGGGAGPIPASETASFPWPLQSMRPNYDAAQLALLPQYTKTGTPVAIPQPTFTKPGSTETVDTGSVPTTGAAYAAVSGCTYPDRYNAQSLGVPANACGAGIVQPTAK